MSHTHRDRRRVFFSSSLRLDRLNAGFQGYRWCCIRCWYDPRFRSANLVHCCRRCCLADLTSFEVIAGEDLRVEKFLEFANLNERFVKPGGVPEFCDCCWWWTCFAFSAALFLTILQTKGKTRLAIFHSTSRFLFSPTSHDAASSIINSIKSQ